MGLVVAVVIFTITVGEVDYRGFLEFGFTLLFDVDIIATGSGCEADVDGFNPTIGSGCAFEFDRTD